MLSGQTSSRSPWEEPRPRLLFLLDGSSATGSQGLLRGGRQPSSHPQSNTTPWGGGGTWLLQEHRPDQLQQKSFLFMPHPATRGAAETGPRAHSLAPRAVYGSCLRGLAEGPGPGPARPEVVAGCPLSRCRRWVRDCLCSGPGSGGAAGGGSASAWGGKGVAAQTRTRAPACPKAGGRCG